MHKTKRSVSRFEIFARSVTKDDNLEKFIRDANDLPRALSEKALSRRRGAVHSRRPSNSRCSGRVVQQKVAASGKIRVQENIQEK